MLAALAGRLPVPPVLGGHGTRLTIGFMAGRHGQDLIAAGLAEPVLAACEPDAAACARDRSPAGPARRAVPARRAAGRAVLVHGDYGPNNALLDPAARQVRRPDFMDWVE